MSDREIVGFAFLRVLSVVESRDVIELLCFSLGIFPPIGRVLLEYLGSSSYLALLGLFDVRMLMFDLLRTRLGAWRSLTLFLLVTNRGGCI